MYIPILTFYLCSRDQNGDKSFQRAMENPNRWHSRSLLKSLSLVTWLRYIPRIHACTGIYRCIPGIYMYVQVYTRYIQVYTGYIQVYTKYLGVYMYVIKNYPWWRRYVLKPQREGGGNNVYGDDIRPFLKVHDMHQIMTQNIFHQTRLEGKSLYRVILSGSPTDFTEWVGEPDNMSSWHKSSSNVQEIENSEERNAYILMDRIQVTTSYTQMKNNVKENTSSWTGPRCKKLSWNKMNSNSGDRLANYL